MVYSSSINLFDIYTICYYFEQIDKAMMDELKEVKRALNPTEVLLVVDAMTGQEAAGRENLVLFIDNEIGYGFIY